MGISTFPVPQRAYPAVETLASLTDYFTAMHQPGGMDPATMAAMTLASRNNYGPARNAAGHLVSSSGDLVNALGQRVDANDNVLTNVGSISYWEAGKQVGGTDVTTGKDMGIVPDWAGGLGKTATSATADQTYAASQAAAAERARQAAANTAAAAAAVVEAARLAKERQDAIDLAARVNAANVAVAHTPPPVFTLPAVFIAPKTSAPGASMLNANRPLENSMDSSGNERTMTGDLGATQTLPVNNTTATAPTDWKKFLPYIVGAIVLLLALVAMRGRKHGA